MPRLTNGLEQVLTNLGIVGSGYKLFFFETGTTTLKTTYSDETLTIANTNPIVLNSAGRPSVDVWGSDPSLYRMILGTPNSVVENITTIVDVDPVDNYQIDNVSGLTPIPTAYWGITAGISTAYTLEEPLVDISSYSNEQTFFIDFHIACGNNPTLKIKDLPALNLKKSTGQGTTINLVSNDILVGRYLCYNNGSDIIVLNPEKPFFSGENIFESTTQVKGVSLLPQPITIANNGTDADHDLDFGAGNFQFDDGSGVARLTALTKRFDATWVAGNNNGGLDTGSLANNTPYYIYAIYNPTTLVSDVLATATFNSPTLPSGFTKKKLIGDFFTNGSANIRSGVWTVSLSKCRFDYNSRIQDVSLTNPSTGETTHTLSIPLNCFANVIAAGNTGTSGVDNIRFNFGSNSENLTIFNTTDDVMVQSVGDACRNMRLPKIFYAPSRLVKINVLNSANARNLNIITSGWERIIY
jgi:hypothetical protein